MNAPALGIFWARGVLFPRECLRGCYFSASHSVKGKVTADLLHLQLQHLHTNMRVDHVKASQSSPSRRSCDHHGESLRTLLWPSMVLHNDAPVFTANHNFRRNIHNFPIVRYLWPCCEALVLGLNWSQLQTRMKTWVWRAWEQCDHTWLESRVSII